MSFKDVSTETLLDHLCDDLLERSKFCSPLVYFVGWLTASVLSVLVYLNMFMVVRFDLLYRIADLNFLVSMVAMLLGSCFFAYGAIANAIPGCKSSANRLGFACTAIWTGLILVSMMLNFNWMVSGNIYLRVDLNIFAHVVVAGLIPVAILWIMVMCLAPVKPKSIAMSACLASFTLSAALMRFFYVHLYNGTDCSYALFLWIFVPFIIASFAGWALFHPTFRMKTIDKASFLNYRNRLDNTVLATS